MQSAGERSVSVSEQSTIKLFVATNYLDPVSVIV